MNAKLIFSFVVIAAIVWPSDVSAESFEKRYMKCYDLNNKAREGCKLAAIQTAIQCFRNLRTGGVTSSQSTRIRIGIQGLNEYYGVCFGCSTSELARCLSIVPKNASGKRETLSDLCGRASRCMNITWKGCKTAAQRRAHAQTSSKLTDRCY